MTWETIRQLAVSRYFTLLEDGGSASILVATKASKGWFTDGHE